jgi:hypothetical protein
MRQRVNRPVLPIDSAAARPGVQPAIVRPFVRQKFLRVASHDPPTVWESDVGRLCPALARGKSAPAV